MVAEKTVRPTRAASKSKAKRQGKALREFQDGLPPVPKAQEAEELTSMKFAMAMLRAPEFARAIHQTAYAARQSTSDGLVLLSRIASLLIRANFPMSLDVQNQMVDLLSTTLKEQLKIQAQQDMLRSAAPGGSA